MDNAFLGPLVSAFGRGILSRYNRGKKVNSNIQRMPLMIIMAWGIWVFSVALAIFFTGSTINGGGTTFTGIMIFAVGEVVLILLGLLFYAWYRNAYVEITRSYVLRRDLFRFIEKVEYRRIRKYGYHERYDHNNNFEDGLYLGGPLVEGHKYSAESVELHSNWANFGYVLGQLAFRIVNERWAEPESDEDQNLIQEYISSGKAREICLEQSGFVFPENDNSPYKDSSEEDSSNE
jgi:hypothetical protein